MTDGDAAQKKFLAPANEDASLKHLIDPLARSCRKSLIVGRIVGKRLLEPADRRTEGSRYHTIAGDGSFTSSLLPFHEFLRLTFSTWQELPDEAIKHPEHRPLPEERRTLAGALVFLQHPLPLLWIVCRRSCNTTQPSRTNNRSESSSLCCLLR